MKKSKLGLFFFIDLIHTDSWLPEFQYWFVIGIKLLRNLQSGGGNETKIVMFKFTSWFYFFIFIEYYIGPPFSPP